MNRKNLQRIADMLLEIPEDKFDISSYRENDSGNPICNSVGCVIGHATKLDIENIKQNYISRLGGCIRFFNWSLEFTGLKDLKEWDWCFSGDWSTVDNTIEGARQRILYLLDKGQVPEGFDILDISDLTPKLYENY